MLGDGVSLGLQTLTRHGSEPNQGPHMAGRLAPKLLQSSISELAFPLGPKELRLDLKPEP